MFDFEEEKVVQSPAVPNPDIVEKVKPTLPLETVHAPVNSIVTQISGMEWVVEYYRQFLTSAMEPRSLDLDTDPVNQQYMKINEFELRVDQGLSPQQNETSKEFNMTGSASVYPGMVPIISDMFIANTGDGLYTLFTVTSVRRPSNEQLSSYEIEYKAVATLDNTYYDNLKLKTSKETYFNKDFLSIGKNPLLSTMDQYSYQDAVELLDEITRYYFDTFFDVRYDAFTVPAIAKEDTIDPYLNEFVLNIIAKRNYPQYNRVMLPNKHSLLPQGIKTVFDYLSHERTHLSINSYCSVRWIYGMETNRFSAIQGGIETSGYSHLVEVVRELDPEHGMELDIEQVPRLSLTLSDIVGPSDFEDQQYSDTANIIFPVTGPRYIFSDAFYEQDFSGMSIIEKMVHNLIRENSIGTQSVMTLISFLIKQANPLEQYYLLPISYRLLEFSLTELQ